jgi:hypothetical protein
VKRIPFPLLLVLLPAAAGVVRPATGDEGTPERAGAREAEATADEGSVTASHLEIEPLDIEFKRLGALRLHTDGNLLAGDAETEEIKVISPAGDLVATIKPGLGPEVIGVAADGTIYCGGRNHLAKLDRKGTVLKSAAIPGEMAPPVSRRRKRSREASVSGLAVSDRDVFVALGSGRSMGSKSKLFRVDRDLENPRVLAEGLRACCQRCDIAVRDGEVYVAENSAHRVVIFDRDGNVLRKWGSRRRTGLEGFGSCCNPMNLCFDSRGILYTAESGIGRVKRYSTEGEFFGLVGYVGVARFQRAGRQASSCSNIAIAVARAGDRVYVMDYQNKLIRVLQRFD